MLAGNVKTVPRYDHPVLVEGSENATIHGIIHESAAHTLSALTGVRVELKGQDPDGLKRGVRLWRKWQDEQGE